VSEKCPRCGSEHTAPTDETPIGRRVGLMCRDCDYDSDIAATNPSGVCFNCKAPCATYLCVTCRALDIGVIDVGLWGGDNNASVISTLKVVGVVDYGHCVDLMAFDAATGIECLVRIALHEKGAEHDPESSENP
jgi:hypothetical protein